MSYNSGYSSSPSQMTPAFKWVWSLPTSAYGVPLNSIVATVPSTPVGASYVSTISSATGGTLVFQTNVGSGNPVTSQITMVAGAVYFVAWDVATTSVITTGTNYRGVSVTNDITDLVIAGV